MGTLSKKRAKVHLEIQAHRSNHYGLVRSSYRENGHVKHSNHGRITGLGLNELKLVQLAIRGLVIPKDSPDALITRCAKEYGASYALLAVAKAIGLHKSIYSRPSEQWVKDCMAMIVGRVIFQGSKLRLSNQWKNTSLWELCGVSGNVDVKKHCYKSMDELLKRQTLENQCLVSVMGFRFSLNPGYYQVHSLSIRMYDSSVRM